MLVNQLLFAKKRHERQTDRQHQSFCPFFSAPPVDLKLIFFATSLEGSLLVVTAEEM